MKITDMKTITAIRDDAHEIIDGLTIFSSQAQHVYDACQIVTNNNDATFYIVDIYDYNLEDETPELYNFSHFTLQESSLYDDYILQMTIAFTDKAEMMQFITEKLMQDNF
jgi:hypothetical protein